MAKSNQAMDICENYGKEYELQFLIQTVCSKECDEKYGTNGFYVLDECTNMPANPEPSK